MRRSGAVVVGGETVGYVRRRKLLAGEDWVYRLHRDRRDPQSRRRPELFGGRHRREAVAALLVARGEQLRGCSAFEVWIANRIASQVLAGGGERHIINHRTLARARRVLLEEAREYFPGLRLSDIGGRLLGAPHTSSCLARVSQMRGRPELVAGVRVRFPEGRGVVVDADHGARIEVLPDDDTQETPPLDPLIFHPDDLVLEEGEGPR